MTYIKIRREYFLFLQPLDFSEWMAYILFNCCKSCVWFVDIDECARPHMYPCYGGKCKNTPGDYECSCPAGTKGNAKQAPCTDLFPLPAKISVGEILQRKEKKQTIKGKCKINWKYYCWCKINWKYLSLILWRREKHAVGEYS